MTADANRRVPLDSARSADLRVHAASPALRRTSAGLAVVLSVYAVIVIVTGQSGLNQAVALLLLAGHLPVAITNSSYLEVDAEGLVIDRRVRRRRLPWSRIAAIRLRWHRGQLHAQVPEIELADGSRVRSAVLADLRRGRREADREILLERLAREAEDRGFELDVERPWDRADRR